MTSELLDKMLAEKPTAPKPSYYWRVGRGQYLALEPGFNEPLRSVVVEVNPAYDLSEMD